MKPVEVLRALGQANAYYPKMAKPLGSVTASILFSQLFYWQDKASSNLGVYKTRDELEDETGLSHNEQRTAIKKLVALNVLTVTEKRIEHKTYYKINYDAINDLLSEFAKSVIDSSPSLKSNAPEVDNVEMGVSTNQSSFYTKNTTEITTETTTDIVPTSAKPKKQNKLCEIPKDFEPNEKHRLLAKQENLDLNREFEKFKDRCIAKGIKFKDWDAGFRNWLRMASEFKPKASKGFESFSDRNIRTIQELANEWSGGNSND